MISAGRGAGPFPGRRQVVAARLIALNRAQPLIAPTSPPTR
jgi:hypothetical protein